MNVNRILRNSKAIRNNFNYFSNGIVRNVNTYDVRFQLSQGEGTDAVHDSSVYGYAVTTLNSGRTGTGIAYTLGGGTDLVCKSISFLVKEIENKHIEDIMINFGLIFKRIADHPQWRWLGPHKGIVSLALASITNACWDMWAKHRNMPLYQLLLALSPNELCETLDFSFVEDVLTKNDAITLLEKEQSTRYKRQHVLKKGYPGYDTSCGWLGFSDAQILSLVQQRIDVGFEALKLKVGLSNSETDLKRTIMVRDLVGTNIKLMVDCNQQWSLSAAIDVSLKLKKYADIYWVEEPTQSDDILAHAKLEQVGIPVAVGEAIPNRIIFKNYMQQKAMTFCQVDPTRTGGVSEAIVVALMAKALKINVVPHAGDMGQISQHLCLFYHIGLGLPYLFLEHIPYLGQYFVHAAQLKDGFYLPPEVPGSSIEIKQNFLEEFKV